MKGGIQLLEGSGGIERSGERRERIVQDLGGDVDKGAGKWLNDKESMAKQTAEEFLRGYWLFD